MSPAAISPISPPSPTLDDTKALTKAGIKHAVQHTIPNGTHTSPLAGLDASRLTITRNLRPGHVPADNSPEVWASNVATDHMLTCSWNATSGWQAPEIKPYGPFSIMPTASVLHYATECFEGLKAYRGHDGKIRLFRPERNARRFLRSATRISLPAFSPEAFLDLLTTFVGLEASRWLPKRGSFIYLRPSMIGTTAAMGITTPRDALLFVVAVCFPPLDEPEKAPVPLVHAATAAMGPAHPSDHTNGAVQREPKQSPPPPGLRLLASRHDMIRAWPGGFGNAKVGANYGPSIVAHGEARERGYHQILWLFGEEGYCTEAGGSNLFVLWKKRGGGKMELLTAPLDDGVILEGVTRASVLELARERLGAEIDVVERKYTMDEVVEAHREGRLVEAFGSGTAYFVAPVLDIHYHGEDVQLPLARGVEAKYAMLIKRWLKDIMYGDEQHPWGLVVDESGD